MYGDKKIKLNSDIILKFFLRDKDTWHKLGFISKDEEIFLFCRSGKRSGKAKKILEAEGYTRVINIGGFEEAKEFIGAKRSAP